MKKNPHLEIERKFLVRRLPNELARHRHFQISQGYLASVRGTHVRLRQRGRECFLTFKRDLAQGREEREVRLTSAQFALLWPGTKGARLTKTRYLVPWKKLIVEIDVYRGANRGLVVAEVEFPNMKTARAFEPPDWLGKEVTGIRRYSNTRLACD